MFNTSRFNFHLLVRFRSWFPRNKKCGQWNLASRESTRFLLMGNIFLPHTFFPYTNKQTNKQKQTHRNKKKQPQTHQWNRKIRRTCVIAPPKANMAKRPFFNSFSFISLSRIGGDLHTPWSIFLEPPQKKLNLHVLKPLKPGVYIYIYTKNMLDILWWKSWDCRFLKTKKQVVI